MVLKPFQRDALDGLRSKEQLELLNAIDSLRSQGISHYVSLPQIIVCGDQSSGKSSVLEAISGVSFPIKSNLCTRFPIELVLRKAPHSSVNVSIVPHESRSETEKITLGSFAEQLDGFDGLPTLIENAKAVMSVSTHGKAFSKDLLRVEVSGPDRPHLTIVDLPGLIHSETKNQSEADIKLVQDVVKSYMQEPRSIILAVVSAKNDYANQVVLGLARAADRSGTRTLGVITKPDTLVSGSESEGQYVSLAENQDVEFRLGWHVLKNMDSELGKWTLTERDASEREFFSKGAWINLPQSILGIENLRTRLSKLLLRQIATELPGLIKDIKVEISGCRSRLNKLGKPRVTVEEQRLYLLSISQLFQSLVKASVDGTYNDLFFENAETEAGYQKRIRAVVQNLGQEFAEQITERGHRHQITDSGIEINVPKGVIQITREASMDRVQHLMRRTRVDPLEEITQNHVKRVWNAVKGFFTLMSKHIADSATSNALFQKIFEPALNRSLEDLKKRAAEMLKPHQTGHPITYNHYFLEALQKVRKERNEKEFSVVLKKFFAVNSLEIQQVHRQVDFPHLLENLVQRAQPDINRIACSEALDSMEAYYNVALERFIDDIAVEVIEAELSRLHQIFTPLSVITMSADFVTAVAGESEENRARRKELTKQLDILTKGYVTCERFAGMKFFDRDGQHDDSTSSPAASSRA
ncbi:hypothetical protein B7463_g2350, partial [Scytalidium lignicola]